MTDTTVQELPPFEARAVGRGVARREGPLKVTGTAPYAFEVPADEPLFLHLVQSTVAKGTVRAVDASRALAIPGWSTSSTTQRAPPHR